MRFYIVLKRVPFGSIVVILGLCWVPYISLASNPNDPTPLIIASQVPPLERRVCLMYWRNFEYATPLRQIQTHFGYIPSKYRHNQSKAPCEQEQHHCRRRNCERDTTLASRIPSQASNNVVRAAFCSSTTPRVSPFLLAPTMPPLPLVASLALLALSLPSFLYTPSPRFANMNAKALLKAPIIVWSAPTLLALS